MTPRPSSFHLAARVLVTVMIAAVVVLLVCTLTVDYVFVECPVTWTIWGAYSTVYSYSLASRAGWSRPTLRSSPDLTPFGADGPPLRGPAAAAAALVLVALPLAVAAGCICAALAGYTVRRLVKGQAPHPHERPMAIALMVLAWLTAVFCVSAMATVIDETTYFYFWWYVSVDDKSYFCTPGDSPVLKAGGIVAILSFVFATVAAILVSIPPLLGVRLRSSNSCCACRCCCDYCIICDCCNSLRPHDPQGPNRCPDDHCAQNTDVAMHSVTSRKSGESVATVPAWRESPDNWLDNPLRPGNSAAPQ